VVPRCLLPTEDASRKSQHTRRVDRDLYVTAPKSCRAWRPATPGVPLACSMAYGRRRHGLLPSTPIIPTLDTTMFAAPDSQTEEKRIVEFLARESSVPVGEVARIYAAERAGLAKGARVATFVPIFAIRNVQEILRHRIQIAPQGNSRGDVSGSSRASLT